MYGGKQLGSILPFLEWGTHCSINKRAYKLLDSGDFKIGEEFPNVGQINNFEDFNGPDGAWLKGEYSNSNMHYNPDTDKGDGPEEALRLLNNLVLAFKQKEKKVIAKEAAWLSHIVTDVLWPPHQTGDYQKVTHRFFFWLARADWFDNLTGSFWQKHDKHSKLEALNALVFWGRKVGSSSIDRAFLDKAKVNCLLVVQYLKEKTKAINQKKIYENFINHGWSKKIKQSIDQQVFPEMISVVATLWSLAYLLSKTQQ